MKNPLEHTEKEKRRKSVERCLAIIFSATKGPNELFIDALNAYIEGEISLSELEEKVDRLDYIEDNELTKIKEVYQIPEIEFKAFNLNHE